MRSPQTQYQTPAALRRIGKNRLAIWLKNRKVRSYQLVASTAVQAAEAQHTAISGQKLAAAVVAKLARAVMALDEEIAETDALIEGRFRDHPHAEIILSMPGIGPVLGAEFIAHTGGDLSVFGSSDRLAGVAGLAPVPKDSGRISGNMRRPRRSCRRLMRVFYMSAQVASRSCPVSRAFYERKRAEGMSHKQAIIALARRRMNVLWALGISEPFSSSARCAAPTMSDLRKHCRPSPSQPQDERGSVAQEALILLYALLHLILTGCLAVASNDCLPLDFVVNPTQHCNEFFTIKGRRGS
ncbi:IS110 family transposase [Streptomyces noursei ATCC 11455]|nr:IS110 family transposase [Streptomyces noursei ATCC 11455]